MIYLDNSATTFPKPAEVYERMSELYKSFGVNPHRGDYKLSIRTGQLIEETRQNISDFFNGYGREYVVFTYNATDSLNIAIRGILEENDEVITTILEHNSVLRPLNYLKDEKGIKVKYLIPEDEKIPIESLKNSLSERTKMVIVNHSSNVTGYTQDIERLGHIIKENSDAYLLVDASQSAGVIPVDQKRMKIDIIAASGHKSLYGPTGIGLLLISPRIKIKPLRAGGSGYDSENPYQPENLPDLLEAGTLNTSGVFGLNAGIDFIKKTGLNEIHRKENQLKSLFLKEISMLEEIKIFTSKDDNSPAIVSLTFKDYSPLDVATILDTEFDIAVRSGLHCAPLLHKHLGTFPSGTLRVSFGYFNTEEDVMTLVNALRTIGMSKLIESK
ncbi:MAG: aminotransferase class V-fold PLP-dependent enzyme [Brevinematia bacterium]